MTRTPSTILQSPRNPWQGANDAVYYLQEFPDLTSFGSVLQDYLFTYKDKVQAVTAEEVLEAAKRHLHPLEQQVVVVADASLNREQLMMQARDVVPLKLS